MNKERDYTSASDESDEDFQPDDLAGESAASEDASDSEASDGLDEDGENLKKNPVKQKDSTKKINRKKTKSRQQEESNDDINTSRRSLRRRDDSQKNGKMNTLEKDELVSDEEDKSRNNALWADFLKDVNPRPTLSKVNPCNVSSSSNNDKEAKEKQKNEIHPKIISSITKAEEKNLSLTEVVNFAGEDIVVEREIDASSIKENKAATIPAVKKQPFSRIMPGAAVKRTIPTATAGSRSGIGSMINQLGKKKKISVLEKSQMDWKSFKQSEGIDEQLQSFNKGRDGYLERQDFLQRTDLRQFEIEKQLRQSTRRPY